jgi:hypothetical protein
MKNTKALNIQLKDKAYLALKKAADKKDVSLAALVREICSDWLMRQTQDIKGVFTYPEDTLRGMPPDERAKTLEVVAFGGSTYNEYGEACFGPEDDDTDDSAYEGYCTPQEEARALEAMKNRRRTMDAGLAKAGGVAPNGGF